MNKLAFDILDSLTPMKMEARRANLLFQHTGMHKEICVSPERLDNENAQGRLIWGPTNWELVPNEKKETTNLTLNFEWIHLYKTRIVTDRLYAVRNELGLGRGGAIALAYRNSTNRWYMAPQAPVPFSVVYVCDIEELTDVFTNGPFDIGDKVELLTSVDCYEASSVGEIIGKYNLRETWAIRMKDNYVIIVREDQFKNTVS